MNDPAWLARFRSVVAEERRQRQLSAYRRDSLLLQEGMRVRDERLAAVAGRERYEPEGGD